ncbi:hypothetical protein Tco_0840537 [Tanacetum coccineum]|uniref:Reverse transcriptase zinc-binding domain-containing protein n=1 Tax=Tanacetum coccineum TaxID=301880 RepID=A0ABQ5AUC0_9ASTR
MVATFLKYQRRIDSSILLFCPRCFIKLAWLISGRTNGTCLLELFPRLYALESFKDCKVNERRGLFNGVWGGTRSWRIPPRGRSVDDVSALISHIGNLHLCPLGSDKWAWVGDLSGSFKVKSLSNKIENICLMGALLWFPAQHNLASRGVVLRSTRCLFCNVGEDTLEHCRIHCPRVLAVARNQQDSAMGFRIARLKHLEMITEVSHVDSDMVS